jgi:glucose/arabinose dehydrogenase
MPLGIVHAGDERLFVIQQNGLVSVVENGRLLPEPFLNIRSKLPAQPGNEQGLLSLVFHPNYAANGYFYVNYNDVNGDTVIARYSVSSNPNQADPNSEQILLTFDQPFINHNGGQLAFGPDGYLYIGVGDGGDQGDPYNNGQKLDSLLGKILRIDVDVPDAPYGIPADNPFVNDENARNEIWAYGLRNPWRFSFDRLTGDLFIADVGQNLYEEVNFQPANSLGGENYGWRPMEASHCYESDCNPEGKVLPIFEYDHTLGCSITGGYVYRGQQYPEMYGNYIVADFCVGRVWRLFPNGNGTWDSAIIAENVGPITSFGEDVHGELYALNRAGILLRVRP